MLSRWRLISSRSSRFPSGRPITVSGIPTAGIARIASSKLPRCKLTATAPAPLASTACPFSRPTTSTRARTSSAVQCAPRATSISIQDRFT